MPCPICHRAAPGDHWFPSAHMCDGNGSWPFAVAVRAGSVCPNVERV
jgi:hypothetical protein